MVFVTKEKTVVRKGIQLVSLAGLKTDVVLSKILKSSSNYFQWFTK